VLALMSVASIWMALQPPALVGGAAKNRVREHDRHATHVEHACGTLKRGGKRCLSFALLVWPSYDPVVKRVLDG